MLVVISNSGLPLASAVLQSSGLHLTDGVLDLILRARHSKAGPLEKLKIHQPILAKKTQLAGGLVGEDQAAFRAEVEAMRRVLDALHLVVRRADGDRVRKHILLVCDCKAAIQICQGPFGNCSATASGSSGNNTGSVKLYWAPSQLPESAVAPSVNLCEESRRWE